MYNLLFNNKEGIMGIKKIFKECAKEYAKELQELGLGLYVGGVSLLVVEKNEIVFWVFAIALITFIVGYGFDKDTGDTVSWSGWTTLFKSMGIGAVGGFVIALFTQNVTAICFVLGFSILCFILAKCPQWFSIIFKNRKAEQNE